MNLTAQFKKSLLSQNIPPSKVTVKNYTSDINKFIRWYESKFNRTFDPSDVSYQLLFTFKKDASKDYAVSSVNRSLSSLRKFFNFLKLEGMISRSPFDEEKAASAKALAKADSWRFRDFKNHLYVLNASNLTIKNYIIDLKQFKKWADVALDDKQSWDVSEDGVLQKIDSSVIEEYKKRLLGELKLSPVSINRKLSSIRRYFRWANEDGFIKSGIEVSNEQKAKQNLQAQVKLSEKNTKDPDTASRRTEKTQSHFPPFRLYNKLKLGIITILDILLILPLLQAVSRLEHFIWKAKGKPVFTKFENTKKRTIDYKSSILSPKQMNVKNVPKSFYAPLSISTAAFPIYKKTWHHVRHTRPEWYKRYHSYSFVSYLHFSILMLFISILGFLIYDEFNTQKQQPSVLAALPTAPPRVLSFQGRLTDSNDNPITTQTNLRMAIYNDVTATGSALLWQEIVSPTPDKDGIFAVILGNNTPIPQSLFAQNSSLWLGVTVEQTEELKPRHQIATVAFAANAETLQGLPPITSTSDTANVILALNSSGNLTIGGSASPTFQATGGTFTLTGQTLVLSTNTGSGGNIVIAPDGSGIIDLQRPLQNTTNSNTIVAGAVQVDDLFVINASSVTQALLTIEQGSSGDLIVASVSGVTKFRINNSGTITKGIWNGSGIGQKYGGTAIDTSGSTGVPVISSGVWSVDTNALAAIHGGTGFTSYTTGDILYASDSTTLSKLAVGSGTECLVGGTIPVWSSCSAASSNLELQEDPQE